MAPLPDSSLVAEPFLECMRLLDSPVFVNILNIHFSKTQTPRACGGTFFLQEGKKSKQEAPFDQVAADGRRRRGAVRRAAVARHHELRVL